MQKFLKSFLSQRDGSMAIVGALVAGTGVVAGGVVLDLSKMSTAKTELMQVLQSACEHGGAASAAGDKKNDVKNTVRKFAENAYDQSNNLTEKGQLSVEFAQGGDSIVVSDKRTINFIFGGLTGIKDSEVSATFSCDVPGPPIDMNNPDASCSGDTIKITNARSFRADADTAETLTASRLISVALIDSNDALLERFLVGDGGDPLYERTDLDGSEVIVIQPVVAGEPVPRTCIPAQPTGGGSSGSGDCLTGSMSGSTVGNELDFDTDGTYQAFFIDRDAGANGGNVSNGPSGASTSASLDGPGVTGGSASVGEGSSASCSSIVTGNTDVSMTSSANGDNTNTSTNTSVTSDGNGTTTAASDGTCDSSSGTTSRGRGNGSSGRASIRGSATGSPNGTKIRSSGTMSCN